MRNCLLLLSLLVINGCSKSKIEVEENIIFELSAGSAIIHTSNAYDVKLTMKSKLPSTGVRVETSATEETSGTPITPQAAAYTLTTASTSLTVQNLPRQKWVIVQVKASSIKTPTNSSSQSFRIIFK